MSRPGRARRSEEEFQALESRLNAITEELQHLKSLFAAGAGLGDIRDEWHEVRHRWFTAFCALALAVFTLSFYFYGVAGQYVDALSGPSGTDLVLERLPRWDVTPVLSYAWLALHLFALTTAFLYYPRRIPYLVVTVSLFICVRALFLVLTPLGPPRANIDMTRFDLLFSSVKGVLTFNNENFFSGHTGLPFLFFLAYRVPWVRTVFLGASIVMGVCVLLARNHYAMDVLGAYFMTYGIYRMSRWLFGWLDPLKLP